MGDENKNPDWLPSDWKVYVKYRNFGRKDKYYINPSNGLKLSSKAEVLRYLKSCSGELQKPMEQNKVDLKTTSSGLPPGWIKEIRTVKKRGRAIKEPLYIDPVSGREFQLIQDVYKYITMVESEQIKHTSDEEDHNTLKLEDYSQSASTKVIGKKGDSTISRCKGVKSEVEIGRSIDSAVTTVAVGKKTKVKNKGKDDSLIMENSDQQTVSRAERYACRMRKREIDGGFHISKSVLGSTVISQEKMERQNESYVEQKVRKDDPLTGDLPNKLQKVNGEEHCSTEIRRNNSLAASSDPENNVTGDQSSLSADAVKELDAPETSSSKQTREHNLLEDQQVENVANPPILGKLTNHKSTAAELPRGASKRLANMEVDPFKKVEPTKKHRATSSTLSSKAHRVTNNDDNGLNGNLDEEIILTGDIGNLDEPNQQTYMNSISDAQKELVRSLFEDPCCSEEDLDGVCVDFKDDEKHERQVEPALENLFMDPCYEFAIKTLKGDIPVDDVKEVKNNTMCSLPTPNEAPDNTMCSLPTPNEAPASLSPVLPAGNIWDDPSFEFAVKMLTSDSPKKDSSHFAISIDESYSSSGASGYNNNCSSLALPNKLMLGDSNDIFSGFDNDMKLPLLPNRTVNGSSSQQFQPVATGLKGQVRKFGEL